MVWICDDCRNINNPLADWLPWPWPPLEPISFQHIAGRSDTTGASEEGIKIIITDEDAAPFVPGFLNPLETARTTAGPSRFPSAEEQAESED